MIHLIIENAVHIVENVKFKVQIDNLINLNKTWSNLQSQP